MNKEKVKTIIDEAKNGDPDSQNNLGLMYSLGQGVKQDYKESERWYRLAAEQGYKSSQFNLGLMYFYGGGVKQSDKEAARWFKLAADQGHVMAKKYLNALNNEE